MEINMYTISNPMDLTPRQREIMEEFAKEEKGDVTQLMWRVHIRVKVQLWRVNSRQQSMKPNTILLYLGLTNMLLLTYDLIVYVSRLVKPYLDKFLEYIAFLLE